MAEEEDFKKDEVLEISWEAPEFLYRPKDVSWYWISGIISLLFLTFAVWQKNVFFAAFIAIAEALFVYFGGQRPRRLKFKINKGGVMIENERYYDYGKLENFWLRPKTKEFNEIIIKKKSAFNPHFKILIDSELSDRVKKILKRNLAEEEYEDTILDALGELIGF